MRPGRRTIPRTPRAPGASRRGATFHRLRSGRGEHSAYTAAATGGQRRGYPVILALACIAALLAVGATPAMADSPWWRLSSEARPSSLPRQGAGEREIVLTAENMGNAPVDGSAENVLILDTLPAGIHVDESLPAAERVAAAVTYAGARQALPCAVGSPATIHCKLTGSLAPYAQIEVRIAVTVEEGARSGAPNELALSGGGAPAASIATPVTIVSSAAGEPAPFGAEGYALSEESEGATAPSQAGAHPFQQTSSIRLNQGADSTPVTAAPDALPAAPPRDLISGWPRGLRADTTGLPACEADQFLTVTGQEDACPPQSAVGVVTATVNDPLAATHRHLHGAAVQPDGAAGGARPPRLLHSAVRRTVLHRPDAPKRLRLRRHREHERRRAEHRPAGRRDHPLGGPGRRRPRLPARLGLPAESPRSKPRLRRTDGRPVHPGGADPPAGAADAPRRLRGNRRQHPAKATPGAPPPRSSRSPPTRQPALSGCNHAQFAPSVTAVPDVQAADTSTGFSFDVHNPQEADRNPAGVADSAIRGLALTLPVGVTLNPSWANGLQACSESEIGYLPGPGGAPGELDFTPSLPAPLAPGVNFCPAASKIATVTIKAPALSDPLVGGVYLASPQNLTAAPQQNPFQAPLAVYIEASDPVSGTLVKLAGSVQVGEEGGSGGLAPGQLRVTFEDLPQADFEELQIHLLGGERAALATPAACGLYRTQATLTPWSGTPPVRSSSGFQITTGPDGGPCPGAPSFAATLALAGPPMNAGAPRPLSVTLGRGVGDQPIQTVQLRLPPGVSLNLSGVALCGEAQANTGGCPAQSQIGHVSATAGLGGQPSTLTGTIYLTGGYGGAPFGLAVAMPATIGPFELGTVVLRAALQIDRASGQATISTTALPRMLRGFPLDIADLNVTFDRPGFTLAPTRCAAGAITATLTSFAGPAAQLSAASQTANCTLLAFTPALTLASTPSTSVARGASLTVRVKEPAGSLSTQANLAAVRVRLPKQLRMRAPAAGATCPLASFEANPAGCPAASLIGHGAARTQLLAAAMEGPVVRLAVPGQSPPGLGVALEGDGVALRLLGSLSTGSGFTSILFASLPDEPFESLELTFTQGPSSALTAVAPLCATKLTAATALLAQNGAEAGHSTPLALTGCASQAGPTRAQRLARALRACRRRHNARTRRACVGTARRRYAFAHRTSRRKAPAGTHSARSSTKEPRTP